MHTERHTGAEFLSTPPSDDSPFAPASTAGAFFGLRAIPDGLWGVHIPALGLLRRSHTV